MGKESSSARRRVGIITGKGKPSRRKAEVNISARNIIREAMADFHIRGKYISPSCEGNACCNRT
jgi:hypothetical protein